MIAATELDLLMNRGWPAAHSTELDGWLVRHNAGVTLRANSVLPKSAPFDLGKALEYVENLYSAHGIAPSFQVGPAAQPGDLDDYLEARGYQVRNPTLVMCAEVADVLANLPARDVPVNISTAPDDDWMDFWWAIDGRGGCAAQAAARQILNRSRALYAAIPSAPPRTASGGPRTPIDGPHAAIDWPHAAIDGPDAAIDGPDAAIDGPDAAIGAPHAASGRPLTAIGRLALVDDWAGLYCLAVAEDHRRQGLAQAIMRGLLHQATTLGVERVWLQVVESNTPARTLYDALGFRTISRYHYRVRPTDPPR